MECRAKIVILGSCSSGKTSLAKKYVCGGFDPNQAATIGAAFQTKRLERDGQVVHLDLWDTAGQERYGAIAPLYYRDANTVLIVYDITDKMSVKIAQQWCAEVRMKNKAALIIVFGNKTDLLFQKDAEDSAEYAGKAFADAGMAERLQEISSTTQSYFEGYEVEHFTGSAKTGEGVGSLFKHVANRTAYTEKVLVEQSAWCCL
ncbi:Ras-related protein Rab-5C [Nematocida major]|uniref:Ras-related protein Rab-5C n=1 Tax=Nematocida major TaxID=1912982 RepID=UPI0020084600|nr:Ras-related protein Rab-5C [Nematocida major]KAH9385680.1 Ras-related protein Rab-5C [Nematocida major]